MKGRADAPADRIITSDAMGLSRELVVVAFAERARCLFTTMTRFTLAQRKNRRNSSSGLARSRCQDRNRWYREAETPDEVSGRGLPFLDQGQ
jgi:hypothetical protein